MVLLATWLPPVALAILGPKPGSRYSSLKQKRKFGKIVRGVSARWWKRISTVAIHR